MLVRPSMADDTVHPVQPGLVRQTIAGLGISENETAHHTDLSKTDGLHAFSARMAGQRGTIPFSGRF